MAPVHCGKEPQYASDCCCCYTCMHTSVQRATLQTAPPTRVPTKSAPRFSRPEPHQPRSPRAALTRRCWDQTAAEGWRAGRRVGTRQGALVRHAAVDEALEAVELIGSAAVLPDIEHVAVMPLQPLHAGATVTALVCWVD